MLNENRIDDFQKNILLQQLIDNGTVKESDLLHAQEQVELKKREEILNLHKNKIWQGNDGKWRTWLPDGKGGRNLKKRSTRESLEDAIIEYYESELENPTIKEVFEECIERRLELHKIIKSTLTRNTQIFNRHFKEFGKRKIKSVSAEDFADFLDEQISKYNLTSRAFYNLKGITCQLIDRAYNRKLIDYDRSTVLSKLDVSNREFRRVYKTDEQEVFDVEETDVMMRYLIENQDIWNLGLLLLFVTGLRIGELVALRWKDVSDEVIFVKKTETRFFEDGHWHYEIKDAPKTDAGRRRVVIPRNYQWILPAIRKLHDDEEFVFVRDGNRLNTNCMRKRLEKINKRIDMEQRSPNKVRKTYCSILFDYEVNPKMITAQMGHTNISCSENFYNRNRKGLDEKIDTMSAIPEFATKLTLVKKQA